jgi:Ser/Thr protein kinase RdoA (MazF antagonist)
MEPNPEHCREVGVMLAKMHLAGQSFTKVAYLVTQFTLVESNDTSDSSFRSARTGSSFKVRAIHTKLTFSESKLSQLTRGTESLRFISR